MRSDLYDPIHFIALFPVSSSPINHPIGNERADLKPGGNPQPSAGPRAPRPPPLSLWSVPPTEHHGRHPQRVSGSRRGSRRVREVLGNGRPLQEELSSLSE